MAQSSASRKRTLPLLLGLGALYLIPFLKVSGETDLFLKVGAIKGESIHQHYRDWIDAQASQFGVSRAIASGFGTDRESSRPQVSELTISKLTDASTPPLFHEAVAGEGQTVDLEFVRNSTFSGQRFYRIRLHDALVSSFSMSSSGGIPTESVSFNYSKIEMTYTEFKADIEGGTWTAWYDVAMDRSGGTSNPNTAPTISSIGPASTAEDVPVQVTFTIGDAEASASALLLSATSSNPALVPVNRITFGGSGSARSAQISPALNQSGSSTITIRVSDGSLSSTSSFLVTVDPVNDSPVFTTIANKVTDANTPITIPFQVNDVDNNVDALVLSAESSNPTLVPNSNIAVSGTGTNRNLTITPAADQTGETTVTLHVSDGALTNATSFSLTVQQRTPQTPSDILLSNSSIPENSTGGTLIGTLSAVDSDSTNHLFSLSDNAGGRFKISGAQLLVEPGALLDFESASSHEVLVKATDGDGLEFSKTLLITLLNVNEAPIITANPASIIETFAGRDTPVSRFFVSDPDAGTNFVSLRLQAINGVFNIQSNFTGTITNNGSSDVILTATLTNLNLLLSSSNGLIYRATNNQSGTDILTATIDDLGHSGIGTNLSSYTSLGVRFYRGQYHQWLFTMFTETELNDTSLESTLWGVSADSDEDGLDNLSEYALGTSPRLPNGKPTANFVNKGGTNYLSLEMDLRRDPDLMLSVEVSGDLSPGTWSSAPSDLETFAPVDLQNGFDRVRFEDRTPSSETAKRFLRMRWTLQNAP